MWYPPSNHQSNVPRFPNPSRSSNGCYSIVIRNLNQAIDSKLLHESFSAFGPILSCNITTDEDGKSIGNGFINFQNEESAFNAVEKVNGMVINGQRVYVGHNIESPDLNKPFTNVYIKNFNDFLDDEKLRILFEPFGRITSHKVMTDYNGRSKGFGFVNFENPDSAERAVRELNGKDMNGRMLYVGRAQKKAERHTELKKMFELRG